MHVLLAILVAAAAIAPGRKGPDPVPASRWQQDIDALARELPRRHKDAFFQCSKQEFEAAAATLRARAPDLADHEVLVGLMSLAAMLGDSHTAVGTGGLGFRSFPLTVHVFSDGPVIIGARESQKDLIGCTLVEFGGVPVDEAFARVMAAAAFENEATFIDRAPRLLATPEIAHAVGLIRSPEQAAITVRSAAGAERTAVLTPLLPGEQVVSAPLDEAALPVSRRRNARRNWFQVLPEHKALYFRYDTCADEAGRSVKSLSAEMLAAIDAGGIDLVVVDLRRNGGGNSGLLRPFIRGLRKRPAVNRPGGVVVLIGRRTFSSAQMNAAELKKAVGAVLVGEPTGQKPNAYGEVRTFTLPVSGIAVQYSTRYWKTEPEDRPSMEPDVPVPVSSADYFAGRDPAFEAALDRSAAASVPPTR
jgi:hypothetical protein